MNFGKIKNRSKRKKKKKGLKNELKTKARIEEVRRRRRRTEREIKKLTSEIKIVFESVWRSKYFSLYIISKKVFETIKTRPKRISCVILNLILSVFAVWILFNAIIFNFFLIFHRYGKFLLSIEQLFVGLWVVVP